MADEMTNVVALHGVASLPIPQHDPQVGQLIMRLAEAYIRGEISAVAIAWVDPTDRVSSTWACPAAANLLTAAVARLQHRLQMGLDEGT